jgi:hypothetical protein
MPRVGPWKNHKCSDFFGARSIEWVLINPDAVAYKRTGRLFVQSLQFGSFAIIDPLFCTFELVMMELRFLVLLAFF